MLHPALTKSSDSSPSW